MILLLIKYGINIFIKNFINQSALYFAVTTTNLNISVITQSQRPAMSAMARFRQAPKMQQKGSGRFAAVAPEKRGRCRRVLALHTMG
jgi:hypothetical protein